MINISDTMTQAFANLLSGLVTNMVYIALFIWGVKKITKQVPHWLTSWENIRIKERVVDKALHNKT